MEVVPRKAGMSPGMEGLWGLPCQPSQDLQHCLQDTQPTTVATLLHQILWPIRPCYSVPLTPSPSGQKPYLHISKVFHLHCSSDWVCDTFPPRSVNFQVSSTLTSRTFFCHQKILPDKKLFDLKTKEILLVYWQMLEVYHYRVASSGRVKRAWLVRLGKGTPS